MVKCALCGQRIVAGMAAVYGKTGSYHMECVMRWKKQREKARLDAEERYYRSLVSDGPDSSDRI